MANPGPFCRGAAEFLYAEYDGVLTAKKTAEKELAKESRKHRISKVLQTAPGLGSIRVAQLIPIVITPHRFRTRRQ